MKAIWGLAIPRKTNGVGPPRDRLGVCLLWVAFALAGTLSGCTTMPGMGDHADQSDLVTQSDEPDGRKRARIRLELAVGYFEQGQTTVALDELKQAIALDPAYPGAYNLRGLIYMRLNDLKLAEDSFRRAIALNARDADVSHNLGWLLCQQGRYDEAQASFAQTLSNATYGSRPKTFLTQGLCLIREGRLPEAEKALLKSYELDAGNPVTGYNLALLMYRRKDDVRARFYIRRLNNSEYANAESLWLGVRTERRLGDMDAAQQLVLQLRKRFPQSTELGAYERGEFND
jgi:type IV pilus assembly protein PilF